MRVLSNKTTDFYLRVCGFASRSNLANCIRLLLRVMKHSAEDCSGQDIPGTPASCCLCTRLWAYSIMPESFTSEIVGSIGLVGLCTKSQSMIHRCLGSCIGKVRWMALETYHSWKEAPLISKPLIVLD